MQRQIKLSLSLVLLSSLFACGGSGSDKPETPITPTNTPPTVSVDKVEAIVGEQYSASITTTDAEGDALILTLTNQPAWLSLDQQSSYLVGTPMDADEGTYTAVSIVVSDGVNQVEQLFDINVVAPVLIPNQAPIITLDVTDARVAQNYELVPQFSDADDDSLTVTLSNQPDWLSYDPQNNRLFGTPTTADEGSYFGISLVVSDGKAQTEKLFAINVLAAPFSDGGILPDNLTINVGDIDSDGKDEILELTKRSMRSTSGHKLLTWDSVNGYLEITPPQVRTYRGHVQDDVSMRVNANIEPGNITMNANLSDGHHINIRLTQVPVTITGLAGTAESDTGNQVVPFVADRIAPTASGYIVPVHNMRRLDYAVTINNDYFVGMDSSVEASVARVEQRMNDTDFFYARDMGLAHEVNWMVVNLEDNPAKWQNEWTSVHQPNGAVFEVRGLFKKPGGAGASGDLFMGGRHTTGTLAAYSKSQGHELGHTLGAGHWSSWGDAMSGSNSALGSGTVERMIGNAHIATEAQSPALNYTSPLPPFAMEDVVTMVMNTSKDIDVLENDFDGNGDSLSISYVDTVTEKGGSATIIDNKVRYTPPEHWQGQDTFVYHVMDETGIANRTGYVKVAVHNNGLATHITFDETTGTTAHDIGPFQAHGKLTDGINFNGTGPGGSVTGMVGNALERNVDENSSGEDIKTSADFWGTGDPLDGDLSVSLWVKFQSGIPAVAGPIIAKGGAVIRGRFGNPRGGWDIGHTEDGRFRFEGNLNRDSQYTYTNPQFDLEATSLIENDTWHHLVMVMDRTSKQLRAWVDNQEITNTTFGTTIADGAIDNSHHPLVIFDSVSQQNQSTDTPVTVDDVRIYHKVLSMDDVQELYSNPSADISAGAPTPANGMVDVDASKELSWVTGKPSGYQFDVYFGNSYESVVNATSVSTEFQGQQTETTFTPNIINAGRYYWRIDTITSSETLNGDVWWFDAAEPEAPITGLTNPPLLNNSFEEPGLEAEETSNDVEQWFDGVGYTYTQNDEIATHPDSTYGNNWAELARGRWIYQQIGTYQENMDLNISFLLGRRTEKDSLDTRISLLVGGDPLLAEDVNTKYESNPLTTIVGATLINSSPLIPALDTEGAMVEQSLTLSTSTGYQLGAPLWLQIDVADSGSGRVLIDNIQVQEK